MYVCMPPTPIEKKRDASKIKNEATCNYTILNHIKKN
jgi:hypothetical protein